MSDPDPQRAEEGDASSSPDDELLLLRQEVAALRAGVRARTDLIAFAGHELRNPLTAVGVLTQALRDVAAADPATSPRLTAGLARLDRSVAQCIKRVNLLLDISRLVSGPVCLELARVDMSAVARDAADALEPVAARRGVRLDLQVQDGVTGVWDELGVQHIVENLLGNAIKYGPGQPVQLRVQRQDGQAVLQVRDHGPGIAEADQARIFAPFERAVRREQAGGFGLGLWVVGRMVGAMAGSVTVESRPGEGAVFTVRLPLDSSRPA